MSRVYLTPKNKELHTAVDCGVDHATGWFFMVFGPDTEDGEENVILSKDTIFDHLFQGELIHLIREYAVDDKWSRHVINQVALDLDPAEGLPPYETETM